MRMREAMNESQSTPPLATYYKVRIDGKRTFELHADSIRIRGSSIRKSVDATIPLKRIEPRVMQRAYVRHRAAIICALLCVVCVAAWGFFVPLGGFPLESTISLLPMVGAPIYLVIALLTFRKVEFAQFGNDAGVVAFDIARSGPERANFDAFVERVVQQIRIARGET